MDGKTKNLYNMSEYELNEQGTYYQPIVDIYGNTLKLTTRNQNAIQALWQFVYVGKGNTVTFSYKNFELSSTANPNNSYLCYLSANSIDDISRKSIGSPAMSRRISNNAKYDETLKRYTYTVVADEDYFCIMPRVQWRTGKATLVLEEFQVEISKKATDYEPYIGTQTYSFYLDEPLRGIGDNWDYIDFKEGRIYRNIKEKVIDGTEDWKVVDTEDFPYLLIDGNIPFFLYINKGDDTEHIKPMKQAWWGDQKNTLSNRFTRIPCQYVERNAETGLSSHDSIKRIEVRDMSVNRTLEEWKAHLAELYNAGNPMVLNYVRAETLVEEVTLPEIATYEDNTTIEILTEVTPSKIELEYLGYKLDG